MSDAGRSYASSDEQESWAGVSVTLYSPAPTPPDEPARNAAVHASGLLDKVDATALNALCKEGRDLLDADWAGIGLIVDDSHVIIASSGGRVGRYERARSITAYAILEPTGVLCAPDVLVDKRFGGNPFIRVGLIRFFVAAPIFDDHGFPLGALCVSSRTPRTRVDPDGIAGLRVLATEVLKGA